MLSPACLSAQISHDRAKKGIAMVTILILSLLWGGWRVVGAAVRSLHALPRSNDDMVFV